MSAGWLAFSFDGTGGPLHAIAGAQKRNRGPCYFPRATVAVLVPIGIVILSGESEVPKYVSLINWTQQGITSYKESPARAAKAGEMARKHGGRLVELYWTLGAYDLVGVFEMPDDASLTAMALEIGAIGGIRTTTLRAFTEDEFKQILAKTD